MIKRMLLCLMALVTLLSSARAETKLRVVADGSWADLELLRGLSIELEEVEDVVSEIANAFAAKNDQIDIFIFPADQGLYTVKKHGFYTPLSGSKRLMKRLRDFYPAVQRALTTDDGELAAWVVGACVMGMTLYQTSVLEDNGLTPPSTFGELLDCCEMILEADALPMDTSLIGDIEYTRQSVLDLYMDQYIRASQLEGGVVSFDKPDFVAMVQRIQAELPDHDPTFDNGSPDQAVFNYPVGFDAIDKDMLAMPQVLPEKAGLVDTYLSVAVVNPYSKRKRAAINFLDHQFVGLRMSSYIYDASLDSPARGWDVFATAHEMEEEIARLEAIEEPTADQRDELEWLRARLAIQLEGWTVSPEAITAYAALSGGISITEASPICYDSVLKTAAKRFLAGAFDAEGFAKECQSHIAMIYEENGVPMN